MEDAAIGIWLEKDKRIMASMPASLYSNTCNSEAIYINPVNPEEMKILQKNIENFNNLCKVKNMNERNIMMSGSSIDESSLSSMSDGSDSSKSLSFVCSECRQNPCLCQPSPSHCTPADGWGSFENEDYYDKIPR